jgi:hypothetical protein
MKRALSIGITAAAAGLLAACGAATTTTSPTPASSSNAATPTPAPIATPTPTPVPTPTQTAVPTSFDPCALVTPSEASSLTGVSYSAGKEETYSGNGRGCVYGAATLNVLTVEVAVASDAATAQADWAAEEAKAKSVLDTALPHGVSLNYALDDVSNVSGADMAAVGTGSATIETEKLNLSAIYLLKGPVFIGISDLALGHAAPSESALESEGSTALGRV